MAISSTTSRVSYVGNGNVDTYSYTFRIVDDDDLVVTVRDTAGVETTLTKTTHYTVSGVGAAAGGSVALVAGAFDWLDAGNDLEVDYVITIRRVVQLTQVTDIRNQGDFYPEVHEDQFDKLTFIDQQQQDEIDRSLKLPETVSGSDFDPTFPGDILDSADKVPLVNATGDGFADAADWPTASAINGAAASAAAASASATDASQHATTAQRWAKETASTVVDADTGVDSLEYSSKEYAVGTQIRGVAGKGSAKDWATYTGGTVDGTDYSAKYHAQAAAASASAAQWDDVAFKVFGDSPITVADGDAGTFFSVDCTGGNVVINLPSIAALTLTNPWSIAFKKTDSSTNTVTINRDGTDTIQGATSVTISVQNSGYILIPDTDSAPDQWSVINFGDLQNLNSPTITTPTIDVVRFDGQASSPSNPAAGYYKVYVKDDGKMYVLNSSGLESSVGGGSGGALRFIEGANAPVKTFENEIEVYEYEPGLGQALYLSVRVPQSYAAGSPINLRVLWTCAATSGDALLNAVATLIRSEVDEITSTTNQRTTTNAAITLSAANDLEPQKVVLDISSSSGQINGVAISAGDLIKVKIQESSSTVGSVIKLIPDASEVTFA